jgi:hypothetical protein
VTDKNGVGVAGLPTVVKSGSQTKDPTDWVYKEDNADLDPKESGFSVSPLQGNALDMPTVLVLDLSGSITGGANCLDVDGGSCPLRRMKNAASEIISQMLPEQRMAIVTFADKANVRVAFTNNQQTLLTAVAAIDRGDGQSTNL